MCLVQVCGQATTIVFWVSWDNVTDPEVDYRIKAHVVAITLNESFRSRILPLEGTMKDIQWTPYLVS